MPPLILLDVTETSSNTSCTIMATAHLQNAFLLPLLVPRRPEHAPARNMHNVLRQQQSPCLMQRARDTNDIHSDQVCQLRLVLDEQVSMHQLMTSAPIGSNAIMCWSSSGTLGVPLRSTMNCRFSIEKVLTCASAACCMSVVQDSVSFCSSNNLESSYW